MILALPVGDVSFVTDFDTLVQGIVNGKAAVLVEGMAGAVCVDIRFFLRRSISTPLNENVVMGPHEGFNETLRDNITLLRRIFHTPDLIGEMTPWARLSPVNSLRALPAKAVSPVSLQRIRERLKGIRCDHVLSIGALEQLLEDHPFSMLPQCVLTERPDRAASFLLEGQVVILMDGAPQALVMPVSFLHLVPHLRGYGPALALWHFSAGNPPVRGGADAAFCRGCLWRWCCSTPRRCPWRCLPPSWKARRRSPIDSRGNLHDADYVQPHQ